MYCCNCPEGRQKGVSMSSSIKSRRRGGKRRITASTPAVHPSIRNPAVAHLRIGRQQDAHKLCMVLNVLCTMCTKYGFSNCRFLWTFLAHFVGFLQKSRSRSERKALEAFFDVENNYNNFSLQPGVRRWGASLHTERDARRQRPASACAMQGLGEKRFTPKRTPAG